MSIIVSVDRGPRNHYYWKGPPSVAMFADEITASAWLDELWTRSITEATRWSPEDAVAVVLQHEDTPWRVRAVSTTWSSIDFLMALL